MLPLKDVSRPLRHLPVVTALIIVLNGLMFVLELRGGDAFVNRWSLIPADIVAGHGWITILTSMFMHAGWLRILGNMVFFWAFGPEIEDVRVRCALHCSICWGAWPQPLPRWPLLHPRPSPTWGPAVPSLL